MVIKYLLVSHHSEWEMHQTDVYLYTALLYASFEHIAISHITTNFLLHLLLLSMCSSVQSNKGTVLHKVH
jgi:hypothetical protein